MTWRPGGPDDSNECTNPRWLRQHGFFVRCGVCQRCRVLRGKDWAGRAIAESKVADRTLFVTLTIGGDRMYADGIQNNKRAQTFQKEDVQLYVKRLRKMIAGRGKHKTGARMRMFWVGEHGDRQGRVHYHMLQYYYGSQGPKDLVLDTYYFHGKMEDGLVEAYPNIVRSGGTVAFWPYGTSHYREFSPKHAYYLAGYVTKVFRREDGEDRVEYTRPGVSTKPLLGAVWFKWLALRYVEQRLSPQDRSYGFAREQGYSGSLPSYWMGEATWRLFCREFVEGWRAAYGNEPWPYSAALEQHLEAVEDEVAGRRPYGWDFFDDRQKLVSDEKLGFHRELALARSAREFREDEARVARSGVKPVEKRDRVDDALNAALAIDPKFGSIGEQEAEWLARFGRFEDHEERWQAEARWRRR